MATIPNQRVIPIFDIRPRKQTLSSPQESKTMIGLTKDALGRQLKDLRISVTDRCNFRCGYCMPKALFGRDHQFLSHDDLLSFDEIYRIASAFVTLGIRKIRLTGGEPLLRKDIETLVDRLSKLRKLDGSPIDIALTTNGSLLARKAKALRAAGLKRVTVSLDAIDDGIFKQMNDVEFSVLHVLAGIDAAIDVGIEKIKINMVVKRGTNDSQIVPMAEYFRDHYGGRVILRFIEYMDVGTSNGWCMSEVLSTDAVLELLDERFGIEPLKPTTAGETAERWRYRDHRSEFGTISSVTRAFCGDCSRGRLSANGRFHTCLFSSNGYDLRTPLRTHENVADLTREIIGLWQMRDDRYSELRSSNSPHEDRNGKRVEMHYIGG
jgi:cyclic pyranopterin phosphate synthase